MNENLKRHRPDIKVVRDGAAIAYMPEDPMGVWVHIQEVRDLLDAKDRIVAAKAAEIEDLKKKLAEYEDCAANACAERDDNQTAIDELNAENEALKAENRRIQDRMCEDVFAGIMQSAHIICPPLRHAAEQVEALKEENALLKTETVSPKIPVKLEYADGSSQAEEYALPRNLRDFCCAVFEAGQENRDILIDGAPIYGPII